jgi:hypothetical protein
MKADEICRQAADLISGQRDRVHGSKRQNFEDVAALWNAYFGVRLLRPIEAHEVGVLQALFKIARTKHGERNPDDYVDGAGYMGCAGELATE